MKDRRFIRVTDVLSPFSGLQHIDPNIVQNAANRGSRVHKVCEAIMEGIGEWDVDDEIAGYVTSFKKWWADGHKILSMEQRFFCSELMITGQVDLIIAQKEGAVILDLKTPAKVSKTWALQGSAYAHLARSAGYDIRGIHFLQLNKHGKDPTLHVYDDQFDMFKKCLDVFNHFYRKEEDGTANPR
jgi:hypothetical protein